MLKLTVLLHRPTARLYYVFQQQSAETGKSQEVSSTKLQCFAVSHTLIVERIGL